MNTEKKSSADTEPYESDRRGDYSSELEYLYHNYQLDKEVPWVRYIALYLVTAIAVACFIYVAARYCPRRLDNPYREPEIIDKLGFFDNTSAARKDRCLLCDSIDPGRRVSPTR